MNIQDLPSSLLQASKKIIETEILDSCPSCGKVVGSCFHTEDQEMSEDEISNMNIPNDDTPQEKLSGNVETVVLNPPYLTFTHRRI